MVSTKPNEEAISLNSRVRFRAVGDEGVLVHMDSGRVIVVSEVGLRIVQALAEPKTRSQLTNAVTDEFDVSESRAAMDVDNFLTGLDGEQVLEQNAQSPAGGT